MLDPLPTGQDLADFLAQGDDTDLVALGGQHVRTVTAMARAYTRGRGFTRTDCEDDIAAVILTAAARLVGNPEQLKREEIGDYSVTPTPFQGWSLAEAVVLNRYRRRAG